MMRITLRGIVSGLCVLSLGIGLTGCLITTRSDTSYTPVKPQITESTLSRVEPGITTKEWVIAACGSPTSRDLLPDGTEILKYEYKEKKDEELNLIFLIHSESTKEKRSVTYFEIKDGIVTRYWQEST